MVDLRDIHSLTGFLRNHKMHLERLRKTGRPEVLTVNGEARVVIQDAEAYQEFIDRIAELEAEVTLRSRLASVEAAEPGVSAEKVLAEIRDRLNIATG